MKASSAPVHAMDFSDTAGYQSRGMSLRLYYLFAATLATSRLRPRKSLAVTEAADLISTPTNWPPAFSTMRSTSN